MFKEKKSSIAQGPVLVHKEAVLVSVLAFLHLRAIDKLFMLLIEELCWAGSLITVTIDPRKQKHTPHGFLQTRPEFLALNDLFYRRRDKSDHFMFFRMLLVNKPVGGVSRVRHLTFMASRAPAGEMSV